MAINAVFGGAGKALSNRNSRLYWVRNTFSILGFWPNKLVLGVFIWELIETPFRLGAVGFATLFPAFAMSSIQEL